MPHAIHTTFVVGDEELPADPQATLPNMPKASDAIFAIEEEENDDRPLIATAVHHGHGLRAEVAEILALDEKHRAREEDPYSAVWAKKAPIRVTMLRSRFEVDCNRPRDRAVYLRPEDAWGIDLWKSTPSPELVARSLEQWDAFYAGMRALLDDVVERHGRFLLLDFHSYNHRRDGPDAKVARPEDNPQINLGTGSLDRERWAPVVDTFIDRVGSSLVREQPLDVRENVRFQGGYFSKWIHENYPESGCALAIEVKKFFMDEWSGAVDQIALTEITNAFTESEDALLEALERA